MGAINKNTNNYEYPKFADKKYKYKCPHCDKNVIFKNGKIKIKHFSHYKSDNKCFYYDSPNESQIHKDAKLLMKTLLDSKKQIYINRTCNYNSNIHKCGRRCHDICFDINESYNENTQSIIEYKFNYKNSQKSADVALIENNVIKYIFEICYKHKTSEENRPEPWFEINASDLINQINSCESAEETDIIIIKCIRNYTCHECIEYEERIRKEDEEEYERRKEEEYERRKEKEYERRKEKEECKCGIMLMNICICETPKYELIKLSNNLYCVNCCKWKCRCI